MSYQFGVSDKDRLISSPTKTYVVVVHDVVCPNEARFVKVILPDGFINTTGSARYYYRSINRDRALKILDCVSIEDWTDLITGIFEDTILEPAPIQKKHLSQEPLPWDNIRDVNAMLDAWNDEQEKPSKSYPDILRAILKEMHKKDKILANIFNELKVNGGWNE